MTLGLLSDFLYSESRLESCLTLVSLHGPVRVEGGGSSTYDWQAKAMPQMGRQRNTPSKRTTLTCSSHLPLSSPCLNEDSTIWGEGGRGREGGYGPNQMKTSRGRARRRGRGEAAPMPMAHRQIMKVMNEERKTEKMKGNNKETWQETPHWTQNLSQLTKLSKEGD